MTGASKVRSPKPIAPAVRAAFLPAGVGWYRKQFTLPADYAQRRVFIEFDGVMANSDVWINGFHLGHRPYGYVSFRYELTGHLNFGEGKTNLLAVRADNSGATGLPLVCRRGHLPSCSPGGHRPRPPRPLGHVRHHAASDRRTRLSSASKPPSSTSPHTPREVAVESTIYAPTAGRVQTMVSEPQTIAAGKVR